MFFSPNTPGCFLVNFFKKSCRCEAVVYEVRAVASAQGSLLYNKPPGCCCCCCYFSFSFYFVTVVVAVAVVVVVVVAVAVVV